MEFNSVSWMFLPPFEHPHTTSRRSPRWLGTASIAAAIEALLAGRASAQAANAATFM